MSSSFCKPVFFLMSSFFTLSFHEIPSRWYSPHRDFTDRHGVGLLFSKETSL